ncbi:MAG: NUDIX domain-containing protein [Bacteroidales bacterium]
MTNQKTILNPHISVDCVIFGFDGKHLKVLLIRRTGQDIKKQFPIKYKLPGDLIQSMEDLDKAAERVLRELTGLENIFLRQFKVFGDPGRIPDNDDRKWLENTSGVKISRVVTTAYYALIKINKSKMESENDHHASWHKIDRLPPLIFDHKEVILAGLDRLRNEVRFEPLCFELLPGKFTIRQIQSLYEVILDQKLDNRNFRKKLLNSNYIEALNEKQTGVAHKPAAFYRFNRKKYQETRKDLLYYNF